MFFFGKNRNKEAQTLILYGSKSGNSKEVAQLAQKYYQKNGKRVVCDNIKSYSPEKLKQVQQLLVVISTHGEGDPPPAAKEFFKKIFNGNASSLSHLAYSVCALGDSSYQLFCEAGRKIDSRFRELGAKNFYPLTECDVDFSKTAVEWIKGSCLHINGNRKENNPAADNTLTIKNRSSYKAKLVNKKCLSAPGAENACYQLTLKAEGVSFLPGDSIEVKPQNPTWLIDKVATRVANSNSDEQEKQQAMEWLRNHEITNVSGKTLRDYQKVAQNKKLANLLQDEQRVADYVSCANVLDMLHDFPSSKMTLPALAKVLPPLRYRQYSLASCVRQDGNFDLMIKPVSYQFQDIYHEGAASQYLCKELSIGQHITFRLLSAPGLHLPNDTKAPVLMIANGSGLAPFRSFLQHREAAGLKGNTWLIFGERRRQFDFYYEKELMHFQKNKVLEKLDVAFSRDAEKKFYVQDVLRQNKEELIQWIGKGAHVYVCGSLKMGAQINYTLNLLLQQQTTLSFKSTGDLEAADRYHEDIY